MADPQQIVAAALHREFCEDDTDPPILHSRWHRFAGIALAALRVEGFEVYRAEDCETGEMLLAPGKYVLVVADDGRLTLFDTLPQDEYAGEDWRDELGQCDFGGCDRTAVTVVVGESGDLHLCGEHEVGTHSSDHPGVGYLGQRWVEQSDWQFDQPASAFQGTVGVEGQNS